MRAAFYTRTGPAADVLEIGERPDPVAGPGEVLVRVRASGINPADVKRRAGWRGMAMEHPLVIPHTDGAGEIVGVGSGVDRVRIGERVWLWDA
ncbi:MAG: alcohol dehydrogenase catalytic domain-containing protein, partial [Nitratireductor sp.]